MAQQTNGFKQDAWKILLSVCALMLSVGTLELLFLMALFDSYNWFKILVALWLLTGHICLWQPLLAYRYGADRLYRCPDGANHPRHNGCLWTHPAFPARTVGRVAGSSVLRGMDVFAGLIAAHPRPQTESRLKRKNLYSGRLEYDISQYRKGLSYASIRICRFNQSRFSPLPQISRLHPAAGRIGTVVARLPAGVVSRQSVAIVPCIEHLPDPQLEYTRRPAPHHAPHPLQPARPNPVD